MEDSFRVRVDRAFGSLGSSSSSNATPSRSPSLGSLWCLTDDEVERRQWIRRYDAAAPRDFDLQQLELIDDDQQEDEEDDDFDNKKKRKMNHRHQGQGQGQVQDGDDEWDVRSSIGLDCTLDFEEEEDEYDKVAIGKEKAGDRLYTSDLNDCGVDIASYNECIVPFSDASRGPVVNHLVAKIRPKQDPDAPGNYDPWHFCGATKQYDDTLGDGTCIKSILKKKENKVDSKSQKRVRFNPECKSDCEEDSEGGSMEATEASERVSSLPQDVIGIPDYLRNPSKYTRYTFNSSDDINDESNQKACMDFLNQLKKSGMINSQSDVDVADLPKSVTFTPKKKSGDASAIKSEGQFKQNRRDVGKEFIQNKGLPIGIAAGDAQESEESEHCAMDEDQPEVAAWISSSMHKPGRQYRTKSSV